MRLAQWRVTWLFLSSSCYQILVLADSLVVRSPPLRQAQERYLQGYNPANIEILRLQHYRIFVKLLVALLHEKPKTLPNPTFCHPVLHLL